MLGRKQSIEHEDFKRVFDDIERHVSRAEFDDLLDRTVEQIKAGVRGKRAAFAWSGGKDSVALQLACEAAGVKPCVIGITHGLEFPAFLAWVTDHMPHELEVVSTPQDLCWLASNDDMLFPGDSKTAGKWFRIVQHAAQEQYFKRHRLDVVILGRRKGDGNSCGQPPGYMYESRGVTRFCPIAEWTHEHVFAAIHYHRLALPPIYGWPRGFRVGTGAWPARQWTRSEQHAWDEVWEIDPDVVREAATMIPRARAYLDMK